MGKLIFAKILSGVAFIYTGLPEEGLEVFKGSPGFEVSRTLLDFIMLETQWQSPVLMGACRDNPSPYSLGVS